MKYVYIQYIYIHVYIICIIVNCPWKFGGNDLNNSTTNWVEHCWLAIYQLTS